MCLRVVVCENSNRFCVIVVECRGCIMSIYDIDSGGLEVEESRSIA